MIESPTPRRQRQRPQGQAFTLIEVMVVLFIFLILAAIALPTVRNLISDQKVASAARNLAAYLDIARSTAIANSRPTGVLFERAGGVSDVLGRAASIRVKQITGVPPYVGESSNSVAFLVNDPNWPAEGTPLRPMMGDPDPIIGLDGAVFDANDNQLLYLSGLMIAAGESNPPIRVGDLIEFPGGRAVPIKKITSDSTTTPATVIVNFDLTERFGYSTTSTLSTQRFPSAARAAIESLPPLPTMFGGFGPAANEIEGLEPVRYKIHRRPVVSSTASMNLPRGVAIDFNYSGVGVSGNQFAPIVDPMAPSDPALAASDIALLFGADGKVINISNASGLSGPPTGLIFFCVGETDGVRPLDLLSTEEKATANLLNLDSTWLVVNPNTGRVVASPNAIGSTAPVSMLSDPYELTAVAPVAPVLEPFLQSARSLALLSDTVDSE
tara:strand:- start:11768 stop:13087 length:1320 start_codon:yes stop_codon:yes gene_type:complete